MRKGVIYEQPSILYLMETDAVEIVRKAGRNDPQLYDLP